MAHVASGGVGWAGWWWEELPRRLEEWPPAPLAAPNSPGGGVSDSSFTQRGMGEKFLHLLRTSWPLGGTKVEERFLETNFREFAGGPVPRTQCFHCRGPGWTPGPWGFQKSRAQYGQTKNYKRN